MLPTFNSNGDWILISKYYRRGRGVQVGDIVSYAHPILEGEFAIKRVLGLPGDFVERDTPGVGKGQMIQVRGRLA
jgi:inner membrane protease subunit 1